MKFTNTLRFLAGFALVCSMFSFAPESPELETLTNRGVIIKTIRMTKFPELKPDGRRWDNYWGQYLPDVYFVIKNINTKKVLFSNHRERIENLKLHGSARFSPGYVINDLTQTYAICIYDYDSVTENDLMGSVVLSPVIDKGEKKLKWDKDGVFLELELEWR